VKRLGLIWSTISTALGGFSYEGIGPSSSFSSFLTFFLEPDISFSVNIKWLFRWRTRMKCRLLKKKTNRKECFLTNIFKLLFSCFFNRLEWFTRSWFHYTWENRWICIPFTWQTCWEYWANLTTLTHSFVLFIQFSLRNNYTIFCE